MTTHTIQTAIDDSIRGAEVSYLASGIDSAEWVALANELERVADGYTERTDVAGDLVREYWGADADGDEWRINLRGIVRSGTHTEPNP